MRRNVCICACLGSQKHFKTTLLDQVNGCPDIVLLFDKSLNKKSQAKQMDVHVRYMEGDMVVTKYLDSVFLGEIIDFLYFSLVCSMIHGVAVHHPGHGHC